MKKLITLLLALVLCLGLCACGADAEKIELYDKYDKLIKYMEKEKYDKAFEYIMKKAEKAQTDEPQGGIEGDLAEKDQARQDEYDRLMREIENLEQSIAEGYTYSTSYQPKGSEEWIWVEGSEALLVLREQLLAMDGYQDTEELAERFVVLEDMLIGTTETWTDALGNNNENENKFPYVYNENGLIVKGIAPEELQDFAGTWEQYNYEYDENDMLVSLKVIYDDTISAVIDITYNADGTVASTEYKNSNGSTRNDTYVYEGGRLVQQLYTTDGDSQYVINYAYNEAGQLVAAQEEEIRDDYTWRYIDTVIYAYDAAGNVAAKRVSECYYYNDVLQSENYVHEWTYTYDGDRLVSALDTHLGNFNEQGEQTNNSLEFPRTHTYNYGQYCLYSAE